MQKDDFKTLVVFRKFKDGGDILALFPAEEYNADGGCMSYQRIGQHSGAYYSHCIAITCPASPEEFALLKKELESLGYDLTVKRKFMRS